MNKPLFLMILIVAGLLQVTLLNIIGFLGVKPDLLLMLVVMAGLFFDFKFALASGLLAGVWKDTLGVSSYGIHTLLMVLLAAIVAGFAGKISSDTPAVRVVVASAGALASGIMVRLAYAVSGNAVPAGIAFRIILIETVYTSGFFALLYEPVRRLVCPLTKDEQPGFDPGEDAEPDIEPDRDGLLY